MEYLFVMTCFLNIEKRFDWNIWLDDQIPVIVVDWIYKGDESPQDVSPLHWKLRHSSEDQGLILLGNSHVVSGSSIVFAELLESKLSYVFGLLLARNVPPLRYFNVSKGAWTFICKLIPNSYKLVIDGPSRWIVAIHAHRVKKTVVDRAQVDHITFRVQIINKRHKKEPLQAVKIKVFRRPVARHHKDNTVRPKTIEKTFKDHSICNV